MRNVSSKVHKMASAGKRVGGYGVPVLVRKGTGGEDGSGANSVGRKLGVFETNNVIIQDTPNTLGLHLGA